MGFVDAVKSAFSNYANFKGRASRSEYWWFVLFYNVIYLVLGLLASAASIFGIVALVFLLGIIVPLIAVAIRRMHDSDKSGWFMLIPFYNLYLAIIKGTDGTNRFGDDPVGGVGKTFD